MSLVKLSHTKVVANHMLGKCTLVLFLNNVGFFHLADNDDKGRKGKLLLRNEKKTFSWWKTSGGKKRA